MLRFAGPSTATGPAAASDCDRLPKSLYFAEAREAFSLELRRAHHSFLHRPDDNSRMVIGPSAAFPVKPKPE